MAARKPRKRVQAIVTVTQAHSFKGTKIGLLIGECSCREGKEVYLLDDTFPYRTLCIKEDRGDTIEIVANNKPTL